MNSEPITNDIYAAYYTGIAAKKSQSWFLQFLLAGLAGAFLALAAAASLAASHSINNIGVAKFLMGVIFSGGLIMITLSGVELFTGNCLHIIACLERQFTWRYLAGRLFTVYFGNFVGSLCIVLMLGAAGTFAFNQGEYQAALIQLAHTKTHMPPLQILFSGFLANVLVCLATWLSMKATDLPGKVLAIVFPITTFIILGFEHSIANMFYLPGAILLSLGAEGTSLLTLLGLSLYNLFWATLGNILGGMCLGACFWWAFSARRTHS